MPSPDTPRRLRHKSPIPAKLNLTSQTTTVYCSGQTPSTIKRDFFPAGGRKIRAPARADWWGSAKGNAYTLASGECEVPETLAQENRPG